MEPTTGYEQPDADSELHSALLWALAGLAAAVNFAFVGLIAFCQ